MQINTVKYDADQEIMNIYWCLDSTSSINGECEFSPSQILVNSNSHLVFEFNGKIKIISYLVWTQPTLLASVVNNENTF